MTTQFGASLTFNNYAHGVINYIPRVITYAPSEYLLYITHGDCQDDRNRFIVQATGAGFCSSIRPGALACLDDSTVCCLKIFDLRIKNGQF